MTQAPMPDHRQPQPQGSPRATGTLPWASPPRAGLRTAATAGAPGWRCGSAPNWALGLPTNLRLAARPDQGPLAAMSVLVPQDRSTTSICEKNTTFNTVPTVVC